MDVIKTVKKGLLGVLTGAAAVAILAAAQAITNYNPVVCSATVTDNCTPQFFVTAWLAVVPAVSGILVAFGNWLKNRAK